MPTSAARSGNPAKRATAKPPAGSVSTAASFKKKSSGQLVELPSGEVARIRKIEITTMISEGLLGDDLGAIAQQHINAGKGITEEDRDEFAKDPEKIREMLELFDKVTMRTWIEPRVLPVPANEDDRDDELLYVDELELQDRIFTFNYASGVSSDLASFRTEFGESLAGLSDLQGVALPAK